jgi:glutathione gamma-glutamylcysteinyltransferase
LSSPEGQQLFRSSLLNNGTKAFFHLISQFHTQTEPAFCGPSTLVMVLNSLNVDPRQQWKSDAPWRWYSEEMLNCCIDLETIRKSGITFSMFNCLARCQGLTTDAQFGSDSTIEDFREAVKKACCDEGSADAKSKESSDQQTYLVVSYNRKVLQQTGSGHFSPIAAYDEASDKVLILDTARFKYTPHWVSVDLIFTAMLSIDKETNKSRGFLLLSFETDEKHASDSSSPHYRLPQSVLFRSKRSQNAERKKFKDYLKGHANDTPFAFQEIFRYWTDDGADHRKVWNVLEPSPIPIDKKENDRVNALVSAIQKLSEHVYSTIDDRITATDFAFGACSMRTVHITTVATIFLIYLATIDSQTLSETLGMLSTESFSGYEKDLDYIKGQILAEVGLIQKAIDLSNGDACGCSDCALNLYL